MLEIPLIKFLMFTVKYNAGIFRLILISKMPFIFGIVDDFTSAG